MAESWDHSLESGAIITGMRNNRQYRIERVLGEGSNGKVYLVKESKTIFALKIGVNLLDMQQEVNVLQVISKVLSPKYKYLIDVDKAALPEGDVSFYVMKYIKGIHMNEFLTKNGAHWLPVIGRNLLEKLRVLHAKGYIFGDIKMENIIISDQGEVELIDYGGVTKKGRTVKQFTEIYDRGFWNAGSRTANSSYDLFAFAVLMLQAVEGPFHYDEARQMLHQNRSVVYLIELIGRSEGCKVFAPVLTQAVLGRYATPNQMIQDWHQITKAANSHDLTFSLNRKIGIPILFIASILLLWMVLSIFVR